MGGRIVALFLRSVFLETIKIMKVKFDKFLNTPKVESSERTQGLAITHCHGRGGYEDVSIRATKICIAFFEEYKSTAVDRIERAQIAALIESDKQRIEAEEHENKPLSCSIL